jgi:hypothetical protein
VFKYGFPLPCRQIMIQLRMARWREDGTCIRCFQGIPRAPLVSKTRYLISGSTIFPLTIAGEMMPVFAAPYVFHVLLSVLPYLPRILFPREKSAAWLIICRFVVWGHDPVDWLASPPSAARIHKQECTQMINGGLRDQGSCG